ncbi:MAG: hypothetical protein IJ831_09735 [Spirochaetales bacterium]|nr:hypothetical protein [Spirochaetales bacterium]
MVDFDIFDYFRNVKRFTDYQIEKIREFIFSFNHSRDSRGIKVFNICPKCEKSHPKITTEGISRSCKQMHSCSSYDHLGIILDFSQNDKQWRELIQYTFDRNALSNLAIHITVLNNIATADTAVHEGMIGEKGLFHRICWDSTDCSAAANLNRITCHCQIRRGASIKLINRHVSLFAYAWKFMKAKIEEMKNTVVDLVGLCSFSMTLWKLKFYRLFEPQNLERRLGS